MKAADYLPHIAYDSVIIGFSGKDLKILIMEYHNTGLFALPGGFVKKNETLDSAVRRGLEERTGLKNIYLEQFHTFGDLERFKPEVMGAILKENSKNSKSLPSSSISLYALSNICLAPYSIAPFAKQLQNTSGLLVNY